MIIKILMKNCKPFPPELSSMSVSNIAIAQVHEVKKKVETIKRNISNHRKQMQKQLMSKSRTKRVIPNNQAKDTPKPPVTFYYSNLMKKSREDPSSQSKSLSRPRATSYFGGQRLSTLQDEVHQKTIIYQRSGSFHCAKRSSISIKDNVIIFKNSKQVKRDDSLYNQQLSVFQGIYECLNNLITSLHKKPEAVQSALKAYLEYFE